MSNKIILNIVNWFFGGTFLASLGIWMTELSGAFIFEYWLKIGVGLTVFLLGLFKIYDWVERKCRKYRRLKKK